MQDQSTRPQPRGADVIPPHLRRLRAYRMAIPPLGLAAIYIAWVVLVGDPLLDIRIHNTILIVLAVWAAIAWPRDRRMLAILAHEVETLRLELERTTAESEPARRSVKENLYAAKLMQGQLDQLNGRLDALAVDFRRQVDAAVEGAFRRGMISGVTDEETGDVRTLHVVPQRNNGSQRS